MASIPNTVYPSRQRSLPRRTKPGTFDWFLLIHLRPRLLKTALRKHYEDAGVKFASKQCFTNICIKFLPSRFNRNDDEFIAKYEKRKAFHTGSNSSCRQHIRQHYHEYQERCKEKKIPEHHWAIPCPIWNKMEEEKTGVKQSTLDGSLRKLEAKAPPQVFTRENLLYSVTQFVAVDDQVNTHQA